MRNLPLVLTTDDLLLDEILRVAAVAGTDVFASALGPDSASRWTTAPLVLVGDDALDRLSTLGWPRRSQVLVLVSERRSDDARVWRGAVAIGAEHVVVLPDGERWLADRLTDLQEASASPAHLVTVSPGRGGAGASTFAILLARAAHSEAVLLDLDPLGGGLDVRTELRDVAGLRWPDLAAVTGRLSASALRGALPRDGRVAVVSAADDDPAPLSAEACFSVVDAAIRGGGLVVADTPRDMGPASRLAWARSDLVVVVAPDDPPGILASRAMVRAASDSAARVVVVLRRGQRPGLHPDDVAGELGVPVVATWRHDRSLARGDTVDLLRARAYRAITTPVLALLGDAASESRVA